MARTGARERARALLVRQGTVASKTLLNTQELMQQAVRLEGELQSENGIQKAGLRDGPHRVCLIDGGSSHDLAQSG